MAKDVSETVRDALGQAVRAAIKNAGDVTPEKSHGSPLSGARGVAAGAGLAAIAPLAYKSVDKLRQGGGLSTPSMGGMASKAGDKVGSKLKDTVSEKVDEAGGAGGLVKEAASGLLGGGDGGGGSSGMPGVGKGRRMPVQQSVDVGVPLETAYNQWTQFEDWPQFMHRVTRVTQEDDCTVSFATKIWGKTKEFSAKIETQRPDERIKWRVSQGITHSGVVTFHELAPNLTRIEVNLDVDPGSLIEKAARGMRHVKRAVRADLARYKAFIEMQELETGAWRGVIEDGELVEPHDDSYDEERDYSDIEDIYEDEPDDAEDSEDAEESQDAEDDSEDSKGSAESDDDSHRARTNRFKRQAEKSTSGGGRSRTAAASRSSSSRSTGSSGSKGSPSRSKGSSSRSSGSESSSKGSSSRRSSRSNGSSSKGSSSRSRSSNGSSSSSARRKASSRS